MAFNLFLFGFIIDAIGKILLGIAVLTVHSRVLQEKKIDKKVLKQFKHEKLWSITGIILILVGSVLQVYHYFI